MLASPIVVELIEPQADPRGHQYVALGGYVVRLGLRSDRPVHRPYFVCTDKTGVLRSVPVDVCRFVGPLPVPVQTPEVKDGSGVVAVSAAELEGGVG